MHRFRKSFPHSRAVIVQYVVNNLRYVFGFISIILQHLGLRVLILLIEIGIRSSRIVKRNAVPILNVCTGIMRKFTLHLILDVYFGIIKIRGRIKLLFTSGTSALLRFLNTYIFRFVSLCIVIATIGINIGSRDLSAEELQTYTIWHSLLGEIDESSYVLIKEGPILQVQEQTLSYLDSAAGAGRELTAPSVSGVEDIYTPTEGEGSLLAPIVTYPGATIPAVRDTVLVYVVATGDTVSTIAQQFEVSINTILWENNLSYNSTIRPGQELHILPINGVQHTVKSGETLSKIAAKYQANVENIIAQNKLADADDISIGEKLLIPNGIKPTTVVYQPRTRNLPGVIRDIFIPSAPPADTGAKLLWPIGSRRITQYFRFRHSGIDIADKLGTPFFAAEAGKVERAGWTRGYGYNIIVNHGGGLKTLYAHASKLLVNVGDTVSRGDTIGLVGSTGWSTGPHLHFEVIAANRKTNPLNYTR